MLVMQGKSVGLSLEVPLAGPGWKCEMALLETLLLDELAELAETDFAVSLVPVRQNQEEPRRQLSSSLLG